MTTNKKDGKILSHKEVADKCRESIANLATPSPSIPSKELIRQYNEETHLGLEGEDLYTLDESEIEQFEKWKGQLGSIPVKEGQEEMKFDYNKPLTEKDFYFLSYEDNGKRKVFNFKWNEKWFKQEYKYGTNWAFKFITEYKNELAFINHLSSTGSEIIYSSTLQSDCTPLGIYLEFCLTKIGSNRIIELTQLRKGNI